MATRHIMTQSKSVGFWGHFCYQRIFFLILQEEYTFCAYSEGAVSMNFLSYILCMVIEGEKCIVFFYAMVSQLTLTGITGLLMALA